MAAAKIKKGDTIYVVHRYLREETGSEVPLIAELPVVSVGRYVTAEWRGVTAERHMHRDADKRGRVHFGLDLGPQVYPVRARYWGVHMDAYRDKDDYLAKTAGRMEWLRLIEAMRRWPGALPPAARIRQARDLLGI